MLLSIFKIETHANIKYPKIKYKYKSTCNSLYMYVSTKKTIHRPLHCVLNVVNKRDKLQKLRHFYCAHFVFLFARHTRLRIHNAKFKVIRPALKEYGFNFVQNRSTTYCYPFLYAGYSCCLLNNSFVIKMKAGYYMKFLVDQLVRISSKIHYIHKIIPFDYVISVVVFLMNTSNNSSLAGCCSVEDIKSVVENAIIPCPDNSWCTATCYRDFIFPTCAKKCHIVLRMGYWRPSYYHACVRCFIISVNESYLL